METQQQETNKNISKSISDIETTAPGKLRVIKRNGKVVPFEDDKIKVAITKAFLAVESGNAAASERIHKKVNQLTENIIEVFKETDFAVTDLSHSKAIIELQGQDVKEVLKKGCPFNFNILDKNNSINSTYNGIAFTVDMVDDNPDKIRLFGLRSFGESLYHSITDASLEFGFKAI